MNAAITVPAARAIWRLAEEGIWGDVVAGCTNTDYISASHLTLDIEHMFVLYL
jgi:hypothetical protein